MNISNNYTQDVITSRNLDKNKEIKNYKNAYCEKKGKCITSYDTLEISEEALRRHKEENANSPYSNLVCSPFIWDMVEIKEMPTEFLATSFFKIPLKTNDGIHNIFEQHSENQYSVFDEYLLKNGDDYENVMGVIKSIVEPMDSLNSAEGYRGTSIQSIALIKCSVAALQYLNETMIPEGLREDFDNLINEYEYFNTKSRKDIAEFMTLDYMVIPDEHGRVSHYIYKDELIQRMNEEHKEVTSYFEKQFDLMKTQKDDKKGVNGIINDIEKYLKSYFNDKLKYRYNKDDLVIKKTSEIVDDINKIWRTIL